MLIQNVLEYIGKSCHQTTLKLKHKIMVTRNQAKLNVEQVKILFAVSLTTSEVRNILHDLTKKSFSGADIRRLGESSDSISYSEGLLSISCFGRKKSGRYQWNLTLIPNYTL